MTQQPWRYAAGIALLLAAAMNASPAAARSSSAATPVAVVAAPAAAPVGLGYPGPALDRIAMTSRSLRWHPSREMPIRRVIQPHVITITPEGARSERMGFAPALPREERIAFGQKFPSADERRYAVIIVRGTGISLQRFSP